MKSLLTLAVGMAFTTAAFAQSTISFGGIYSTPVGEYGKASPEEGGYAEAGYGVQFEAQMQPSSFVEQLRIGLYLSFQNNGMNIDQFRSDFNDLLVSGYTAEFRGGGFRPVRAMIGPTYFLKLNDKFSMSAKGAIGMLMANSNPIEIEIYDDSNGNRIANDVLYFEGRTTFSFLVGLDFSYALSKYWAVGLFADYSAAKEELRAAFDPGNVANTDQYISFVNTGIMMRMTFN